MYLNLWRVSARSRKQKALSGVVEATEQIIRKVSAAWGLGCGMCRSASLALNLRFSARGGLPWRGEEKVPSQMS